MFCCNKCDKSFKTNWQLQRHFSNKRPCKKFPQETPIFPQETPLFPQETPIFPQETPIFPQETPIFPQETPIKCEYCCEKISRLDNLKRHEKNCKERNCQIRNLEIKMGMQVEIDIHSKICRYCQKEFSQKCHHTRHVRVCKAKNEYLKTLEMKYAEKLNECGKTINNNCNNNTMNIMNNTYVVNSLGNENISYITCEVIKGLLKDCSSNEEFMAKTLAYVHAHEEHPENHNIVYSNLRSNAALVKYKDKFEYKNIDVVLKRATSNWLDHIGFSDEYDKLSKGIKKKYEEVCEDDELNKTANSMVKMELYNGHKVGNVKGIGMK